MASIEWMLNKLPLTLKKEGEEICPRCHKLEKIQTIYDLQIETFYREPILGNGSRRYAIYYESRDVVGRKIIGNSAWGEKTLKEALKVLLSYKNEIRGIN